MYEGIFGMISISCPEGGFMMPEEFFSKRKEREEIKSDYWFNSQKELIDFLNQDN